MDQRAETRDAYDMSKLIGLIDDYKDRHGQPSDASIARAIGVAPQTVSSWRKRGIRELPSRDALRNMARFLGVPFSKPFEGSVLEAVLSDIGWLDELPPTMPDEGVKGA